MSTYTAGPWRAGRSDMVTLARADDDGEFVKNVYCDDARGGQHFSGKALPFVVARAYGDEVECVANANLIAAAPELLEALQGMLAAIRVDMEPGTGAKRERRDLAVSRALAAIAKATGDGR